MAAEGCQPRYWAWFNPGFCVTAWKSSRPSGHSTLGIQRHVFQPCSGLLWKYSHGCWDCGEVLGWTGRTGLHLESSFPLQLFHDSILRSFPDAWDTQRKWTDLILVSSPKCCFWVHKYREEDLRLQRMTNHDPWAWECWAPLLSRQVISSSISLICTECFQLLGLNPFPLDSPKKAQRNSEFSVSAALFAALSLQIQVGTVENILIIFFSPALPLFHRISGCSRADH